MLDYQPTVDATVVSRLRAAGAIFMGKSNLPELASAPHCWSPIFGLTRNPWDLELTPGGSSGGSAVAIAAGFSLLEIGSDIGGSIRIPAAYCGIAGLRATENRIPRTGHIPHLPSEFSKTGRSVWHMLSMGVLAGSVADLHLGYSLIAGPDEKDSTVISFTKPEPLPNVECIKTTKLKIAIWDDFGTPCCPATRRGIENVINQLKAEGHDVVRAAPADFDVNLAWETFGMLGGAEIGLGIPSWQAKMGSWLSRFLPKSHAISKSFSRGLAFDLRAYNQALNNREKLISGLEEFLGGWDAVLCPVAPTLPYPAQAMPIHKLMPKIIAIPRRNGFYGNPIFGYW
jgi:amidase